jgi:hypothetical protein
MNRAKIGATVREKKQERTMSQTIHVACGGSAASNLVEGLSISPTGVATLHDDLSYGPLDALRDAESWSAMRLAFWTRVYGETENQKPRRRPAKRWAERYIIDGPDRIANAKEVVLWIGTGLDDQLTLAWMPHFLRAIGSRVDKLRVVQFERTSAGAPIPRLGPLLRTEVPKHPPPRPFDHEELLYLDEAWRTLTAPDPVVLLHFLGQESVPLPLLQSALKSILRRYPDAHSGVNRFEKQLLASTRDHGPAVTKVVGWAMREFEEDDSAGDVWLFWRLRRLADPTLPYPALTMTGTLTTMRGTEARLTPVGEQIAKGELNFVQLNGIEDWIGGVHLDSRGGNVWFHRNETIVRG